MLRSNSRRVPPRKKSGRVSVATSRGIGFFVERDADAPDMVDDVGVSYVCEQGKVERVGKEQIVEFPADPVEHFVRQAVAEKREVDIRAVPDGRNRRVVSVTSFRSFFRREL